MIELILNISLFIERRQFKLPKRAAKDFTFSWINCGVIGINYKKGMDYSVLDSPSLTFYQMFLLSQVFF